MITTPPTRSGAYLTTGDAAKLLGVQCWQIRRLFELGRLPEPAARAGTYRLIPREDLARVKAALEAAGWLPAPAQPEAPAAR